MGPKYPWAYVSSWADQATVLSSSAEDAMLSPQVLAGCSINTDADTLIDWAVWIDGQRIVEGG